MAGGSLLAENQMAGLQLALIVGSLSRAHPGLQLVLLVGEAP